MNISQELRSNNNQTMTYVVGADDSSTELSGGHGLKFLGGEGTLPLVEPKCFLI